MEKERSMRNMLYGINIPLSKPLIYTQPIFDRFVTKKIGHTFFQNPIANQHLFLKKFMVQDFIFDESLISGAVNDFENQKLLSFNASNQIIAHLFPENDKSYVVKLPPGVQKGYFSIEIGRELVNKQLLVPGFYDAYPIIATWGRLKGNAPQITYANFFIQNSHNCSLYFSFSGEFTSDFSFDYLELTGNFPARNFTPVVEFYNLFSYASPTGLHSPKSLAFAMFGYQTDETNDPGAIIHLKKPN
jgi:hypothetical protein